MSDDIDMKPKSKMIDKFDHLSASALVTMNDNRAKLIKKYLEDVVEDDQVKERILSRRLKKGAKAGKGPHRFREPTEAKSAKALSCDQKLAQSQAVNQFLYESLDVALTTPSYLFVQMSEKCILENAGGTPVLKALKEDFLDVTEAFTDRPIRHEFTNTTADFFSAFNEYFDDGGENGKGWPNAFVGSYVDLDYYGYELKQYPDQAAFTSIEDLLEGEDSVTFDHCSFFIDSWWRTVVHDVVPDIKSAVPAAAGAGAATGYAAGVTAVTDGIGALLAPVVGAACNAVVKKAVSNMMD